jgi:hypothetical protein
MRAMNKAGWLSIVAAAVLLAFAVIAEAQPTKKVFRIGLLSGNRSSPMPPQIEALRQGLRELGYVEGKTSQSSIALPKVNRSATLI